MICVAEAWNFCGELRRCGALLRGGEQILAHGGGKAHLRAGIGRDAAGSVGSALRKSSSSKTFTLKYPLRISSGTEYSSEKICSHARGRAGGKIAAIRAELFHQRRQGGRSRPAEQARKTLRCLRLGSIVTVMPW